MKIKKLGIIAGSGELPQIIVKQSQKKGVELVCILLTGFAKLSDYKKIKTKSLKIGLVGKAIDFFRQNDVKHIVFAGGVKKPSLKSIKTDKKGLVLLTKLLKNKLFGDDKVLTTVVDFFAKEGFKVISVSEILTDMKIKKGFAGHIKIKDKEYLHDIKLGQDILKKISSLDIGQSIVVQQGMVLGMECIEGTAELIKRCGSLKYKKGRKPVLIKIKKAKQTEKADLPTIGKNTIEELKKAGFAGIALDYKNTLVLKKKEVINSANKKSLFILGV